MAKLTKLPANTGRGADAIYASEVSTQDSSSVYLKPDFDSQTTVSEKYSRDDISAVSNKSTLEVNVKSRDGPSGDNAKSEEHFIEYAVAYSSISTAPSNEEKTEVFPEGGRVAWCVAAGNAGVMFCTLGYVYSFGVFQEYYQLHNLAHRTPSDIAWIGSTAAFFVFAASAIGGPLFDRYGVKVIRVASVSYVVSIMMTSICEEYYQFMLAHGVFGGISCGIAMTGALAATPQYFSNKRGTAMGISVAGSSLGGVVFPVALSKMLYNPRLGHSWSIRICGFIIAVVLLLSTSAIKARLPPRKTNFFLLSAFNNKLWLTISVANFFMLLGMFTPYFYLPTYAVANDFDEQLASYLPAILSAASLPGRIIPGILSDRLGRLNMFAVAGGATGILLFIWLALRSAVSIIVFAVAVGFWSGAIVSGMAVTVATCPKNPQEIGTYMGMGMSLSSVAALVGPPVCGQLLTHYRGFDQLCILGGVCSLTGAVIVVLCKRWTTEGLFGKV